jgi:hypothetical protein
MNSAEIMCKNLPEARRRRQAKMHSATKEAKSLLSEDNT